MNKKLITLGIVLIVVAIVGKLLWSGIKNIKIDDFKPSAVIFLIDSSASNQNKLTEQKKFLKQVCSALDPEDQIKILKVSESSYLIYEGTPHDSSGINKAMESFTKYDENDKGTAYGLAMKKAFSHVLTMKKDGYVPAIVVLGDLENEGDTAKQINWDTLPKNVQEVTKYAHDLSMMFAFAHPEKLDMVKETLAPILGEKKLIVSTEENSDKAIRKFINAIGR